MERARTEATGRWPLEVPPDEEIYTYPRRAIREHKNAAFVSGALWAVEQEPTDEEVEAAAYEIYRRSYRMTWVSWDQLRPYVKTPFRSAGRAALIAAQKVRARQ